MTFLIDILRNIPWYIKNNNFAIMEFHMLKPLFYSKTSFLFLCKATFFMSLYYSSLRVLRVFKFFFYFFILFKFPIWTIIPIIKKTTKKIYFLTYSHSKNKRPVEKISCLESLWNIWYKKYGYVGCICQACGWKWAVGKVCEMVNHLALSC